MQHLKSCMQCVSCRSGTNRPKMREHRCWATWCREDREANIFANLTSRPCNAEHAKAFLKMSASMPQLVNTELCEGFGLSGLFIWSFFVSMVSPAEMRPQVLMLARLASLQQDSLVLFFHNVITGLTNFLIYCTGMSNLECKDVSSSNNKVETLSLAKGNSLAS